MSGFQNAIREDDGNIDVCDTAGDAACDDNDSSIVSGSRMSRSRVMRGQRHPGGCDHHQGGLEQSLVGPGPGLRELHVCQPQW